MTPQAKRLTPEELIVLVACEESQVVCKAFREKGFTAFSCDLQSCSGGHPEWHIQGDALEQAYSGKYDLMIAHPPCTFLSKAGARWLYSGGNIDKCRYEKGMNAKRFFDALMNAPIRYIAIENPTPLKIFELPKHSQRLEPYAYGHPYSKRTLLWLKNLPLLSPTKFIDEYKPYLPSNTGGKKRGESFHYTSINQKEASTTFQGIAEAMADQWGQRLIENFITGHDLPITNLNANK